MSGPAAGLQLEIGSLDAGALRVRGNERGLLAVRLGDGEEIDDVSVRRAFPLELTDGYIAFFDADGEELGILERVEDLDAGSRRALEDQLSRTYFLPVITEVIRIGEDYGVVQADVQTTSGPRHIEIRGIRSNIRILSRNRALVEDTDGNRYELRDFHRLPQLTREILGL